MVYHVIYDGNCNLCVNLVKVLEQIDQGKQFRYAPMQDQATLDRFNITAQDCELGMILINAVEPNQRWQGSAAAEEIGRLLPMGQSLVEAYRALPGTKWVGDRLYEQIRDNRYFLFGQRGSTYDSAYPICGEGNCDLG
jgi:predicted DCC family thiol-disulfide oxidoreductase YuxK